MCICVYVYMDIQLYYIINTGDKIKIFHFNPKYYNSELKQNTFHFSSVCNILYNPMPPPKIYTLNTNVSIKETYKIILYLFVLYILY